MKNKTCFKCGKSKPMSDFYKHPYMADGRLGKCKECARVDVAENYKKRKKQYAAYERKRFKDPERKKKVLEYARAMRAKNPEKTRARSAFHRALRIGKIKRQPCEVCGKKNAHGHHTDYSKPLEVRWLCFKHHMEAHGKEAIQ